MDPFSRVAAIADGNSRPVCRGCLCTDKKMKSLSQGTLKQYFLELANINISESDGLPQWVCWECIHMFERSTKFRQKIMKCNDALQEHLAQCAPFPLDVADADMCKYRSPLLMRTEVLVLETSGKKTKSVESFVYHTLRPIPSEPCVKAESVSGLSDLDRDCLLQDFKYELALTEEDAGGYMPGSEVKIEPPEESDIYDDDEVDEDQPLGRLRQKLSLAAAQSGDLDGVDALSGRKLKRKSSRKKIKGKEREKRLRTIKHEAPDDCEDAECDDTTSASHKRPARKAIWLDPTKIRLIKLTPAEQAKQREEDSRNETYLKFPFKCERCYKGFNYEQKLKNHLAKHNASRGAYECAVCGMRLPTVYSYNVHAATHSTRYECVACERRMADKASILEHYARAHEGVAAHYCCDICGKVSANSRTHRGHIRNHHSGDRPKCDRCGKTFVNKDSLNEHILIHTGVKEHSCETCGKRFRTKTQAKHHQLKHSDARDFYCVECDMRFKSRHNLKQHLLKSLRHVDVESLKHACDRCDKRFDSPKSLEHHVQFQHLGRRLHVCAACGAALATRNSLAKHIRVAHEGYRAPLKHVCETCGKAFRGKNVLINHVRVHTGEKPYDCNECGRKFSQRAAMRTHIKLVHLKIKRNASVANTAKTNSSNIVKKTTDNLTVPISQQLCVVRPLPVGDVSRSITASDVVRPLVVDQEVSEIAVKEDEDRETKSDVHGSILYEAWQSRRLDVLGATSVALDTLYFQPTS